MGRLEAASAQAHVVGLLLLSGFCAMSVAVLDLPIAIALNSPPTVVGDIAALVSAIGSPWLWYGAAMIAGFPASLMMRRRGDARAGKILYASGALMATWLTVVLLKFLFGRFRPELFFEANSYGFDFFEIAQMMKSFPSGHTACAFAVATVVAVLAPRYRALFLTFAIAVAASRMALGIHFLADVVAGAYLGVIVPVLVSRHPIFARPRMAYGTITTGTGDN